VNAPKNENSLNRTAHVRADILALESPLVNTVVKEIITLTGGTDKASQGRQSVGQETRGKRARGGKVGPTPEDKSAVVLSQIIYDACAQSSQLSGQAPLPLVS